MTETGANQNGFTTTDTVTADPNNDTTDGIANGTIVGGSQQSVSFQNNYKADEPAHLRRHQDRSERSEEPRPAATGALSDEFTFQIAQSNRMGSADGPDRGSHHRSRITQQTDQQAVKLR